MVLCNSISAAPTGQAAAQAQKKPPQLRNKPDSPSSRDGGTIGSATATEAPHGALLRVQIAAGSLSPGAHGMHLHAVADCSDVGTFKLSTGHINPSGRAHGLLNPDGPDNADLPPLIVHADGTADVEIFTVGVTLAGGDVPLLDEDGSALVIHANPDDHITQPIGGAGPRLACGAVTR